METKDIELSEEEKKYYKLIIDMQVLKSSLPGKGKRDFKNALTSKEEYELYILIGLELLNNNIDRTEGFKKIFRYIDKIIDQKIKVNNINQK